MMVVVSAVEVGSVRALAPVCVALKKCSVTLAIEEVGFFTREAFPELAPSFVSLPKESREINSFLQEKNVCALLFSVNVHDIRPLQIARVAEELGIPTLHLLDYWNGYRSRMELDGGALFQPTSYLVPDQLASQSAKNEGIAPEVISIVGQPAFSDWRERYHQLKERGQLPDERFNRVQKCILFVGEPVAADQGSSLEENRNYRGYVETDAMQILIEALEGRDEFWVAVLPHPRQAIELLKQQWSSLGGEQVGSVVSNVRGRDLIPFVEGVCGMASTLLYEAWLVGKPVMSIQPGVRFDSMRMMKGKEGVVFVDQYESGVEQARQWLRGVVVEGEQAARPDLLLHEVAPKQIVEKVIACCDGWKTEF